MRARLTHVNKDIDTWIHATEVNGSRLVLTLEQFGFGSLGLKESDFLEPDMVVQLGYPPRRIDLLTQPSGVSFDECYAKRVIIGEPGSELNLISLQHLKANKKASGRPQDLADLTHLF